MGNVVSFNSPRLEGASTLAADNQYAFETSYAFDPKGSNAFGVPATITFGGTPGPITPVITVPAAATDGVPSTYQCDPFPEGISTSSVLCPGLKNTDFHPGTVSIAFTSGDSFTQGYYSGVYAFSVTTVSGGGESTVTVFDSTKTVSSTDFVTLSKATTKTVRSTCASATATSASSGTGFSSGSVGSTGSLRSSNSTMPRPTGSSFRPSGSVSPSGTASRHGTGTGSVLIPSGSGSSSSKPSSGPSGSGSSPSSSGLEPSGSGLKSSGSGNLSGSPSASMPSPTGIQTITNSGVTATSTSTRITTITITTTITTYVPCSSAIATRGTSTIYSSYLTESIATKTITSVITQTTIFCPATEGESQAVTTKPQSPNRPVTTVVITITRYTCPSTPPPPCPTDAPMKKRNAGFDGPDYTLTGGETGPSNGAGSTATTHLPVTTSTVTVTSTSYQSTITTTQGCQSSVSKAD